MGVEQLKLHGHGRGALVGHRRLEHRHQQQVDLGAVLHVFGEPAGVERRVFAAGVEQDWCELFGVQQVLIGKEREVLHQGVAELVATGVEGRRDPQHDLLRWGRCRQSEKQRSNCKPAELHCVVVFFAEVFFTVAGAAGAAATAGCAAAGSDVVSSTDEMTCGPVSCVEPPPPLV